MVRKRLENQGKTVRKKNKKTKEKSLEPLTIQRVQDFCVWQGQKDLNPRHVVLETVYECENCLKRLHC